MNISKIVLGTAQFGFDYGVNNSTGKPSEKSVAEILNFAKSKGIDELDTADGYGESADVLGRYFIEHKNSFKVMTKFSKSNELNFSEIFNESIRRLQIEKLEGYYFHRFSDFLGFDEYDQVHSLKKSGKLKKLAVSLYSNEDLEIASEHPEIDLIQLPFNLLDRGERKVELLMKAKKLGKQIYVRSAFLQGLFFMDPAKLPAKLQPFGETIREIRELAEFYQMSVEEVCLNYVYHKNYIDKVVIGVDSCAQLEKNVNSLHESFSKDLELKLEQLIVNDVSLLNPSNWK